MNGLPKIVEHVITEPDLTYQFGGRYPIADVLPGQVLRTSTEDCFSGAVRTVDDLPSKVCQQFNPVTGPVRVPGAEPGDTLALHFVEILPARDWGMSATFPHFGALTGTHTTAMLHPALPEIVWRYDIDTIAGVIRYQARRSGYTVELPLDPMLGTVGVAPAGDEVRSSIVPDVHGGNLDTPEHGRVVADHTAAVVRAVCHGDQHAAGAHPRRHRVPDRRPDHPAGRDPVYGRRRSDHRVRDRDRDAKFAGPSTRWSPPRVEVVRTPLRTPRA